MSILVLFFPFLRSCMCSVRFQSMFTCAIVPCFLPAQIKLMFLNVKSYYRTQRVHFPPTGNNYLYGHIQLLNKANVIITAILHGCDRTCQFSHTCSERKMRFRPNSVYLGFKRTLCNVDLFSF